jgi:hypothetical protein
MLFYGCFWRWHYVWKNFLCWWKFSVKYFSFLLKLWQEKILIFITVLLVLIRDFSTFKIPSNLVIMNSMGLSFQFKFSSLILFVITGKNHHIIFPTQTISYICIRYNQGLVVTVFVLSEFGCSIIDNRLLNSPI